MKTFKQFVQTRGSGVIPVPIHFKHVPMVDITRGIIPVPIHFKYVPTVDQKDKLKEEYKVDPTLRTIHRYREEIADINKHVGKDSYAVADELNRDNAFTNEHHNAIHEYTSGASGEWNRGLIARSTSSAGYDHTHINNLTDAIHKNRVQHNIHTWSGVGFEPDRYLDAKRQMRSPAFISTSLNFQTALGMVSLKKPPGESHHNGTRYIGTRHVIHLELHPNDPATSVTHHSEYPDENEVILQRGVTLQHHGYEDFHHYGFGSIRVHKMTVAKEE